MTPKSNENAEGSKDDGDLSGTTILTPTAGTTLGAENQATVNPNPVGTTLGAENGETVNPTPAGTIKLTPTSKFNGVYTGSDVR